MSPAAKDLGRRVIHREEALHTNLLQGHVVRGAQGRDGGEQAKRRLLAPEMDGEYGRPGLGWIGDLGERRQIGEGE